MSSSSSSSSSSPIQVQLSLQEVSVLLALLDVLATEELSPEVARLAEESQQILRTRAEAAKYDSGH